MITTRNKLGLTLAAALLGLGLSLSGVQAADDAAASSDQEMLHHGHHQWHQQMEKVHDQLKLTTEQEKTWQSLMEANKAAHKEMREQHKASREQLKQELNKADPDLTALAAARDRQQDAWSKQHRELRDKWLQFYATLTPEQKATAKTFLLDRLADQDKRREEFREKHHHDKDKTDKPAS